MKLRRCVWVSLFFFAWILLAGHLIAAEDTKPKQVIGPVKNGVRVYTSSRVLIGVIDKEAKVEVLQKSGQWCQVQYTKDGSRFVGWVLKEDLALPENKPPEKEKEPESQTLSLTETSEKLRQLVRVGVNYKATRGDSWKPDERFKFRPRESMSVQMQLRFDDKGAQAKLEVLARFQKDDAIELYVETKIVALKEFRKTAHPDFYRVIDWYISALEAYNEDKIPNFKSFIRSAERFWEAIETRQEMSADGSDAGSGT